MRVQLSEKSKAEFIELITEDSITCWFEGDEFVMPSGQGKTAKGIVLGKLLVWQNQQLKIDELQKRVDALGKAEFKLAQVKAILQNNPKLLESILVKKIEQALKGGDQNTEKQPNKHAENIATKGVKGGDQ